MAGLGAFHASVAMKAVAGVIAATSIAVGASAAAKTNDELVRAVDHATSIALISLEPGENESRDAAGRCAGYCYFGWSALGQTVAAPAAAASIRKALTAWIVAPEPAAVPLCFNPRHGVRVQSGGHVYDFVVCFECSQAQVFKDSAPGLVATIYPAGGPDDWDALLSAAGIPLAVRDKPDGG